MKLLKLCFLSLVMASSSLYAKESAHIVSASESSSSLNFTERTFADGYDTTFGLSAGYDYAFAGGFQFGGTASVSIFSGGSATLLTVGPGYNFNTDVESSFYALTRVGVVALHIDSADTETHAVVGVELGKRFKIMENVSYTPAIKAQKLLGSNTADPSFSLEIFKLSLVF